MSYLPRGVESGNLSHLCSLGHIHVPGHCLEIVQLSKQHSLWAAPTAPIAMPQLGDRGELDSPASDRDPLKPGVDSQTATHQGALLVVTTLLLAGVLAFFTLPGQVGDGAPECSAALLRGLMANDTVSWGTPPPPPRTGWRRRLQRSSAPQLPQLQLQRCVLRQFTPPEAKECLSRRPLVMIGDSVTRYQFLSLIYWLDSGEWPPPMHGTPDHPSPMIESEWQHGWADFFRGEPYTPYGQSPAASHAGSHCCGCAGPGWRQLAASISPLPPCRRGLPACRHHRPLQWTPAVPLLQGWLGHPRGSVLCAHQHRIRLVLHVVWLPAQAADWALGLPALRQRHPLRPRRLRRRPRLVSPAGRGAAPGGGCYCFGVGASGGAQRASCATLEGQVAEARRKPLVLWASCMMRTRTAAPTRLTASLC